MSALIGRMLCRIGIHDLTAYSATTVRTRDGMTRTTYTTECVRPGCSYVKPGRPAGVR